jgi:hypothetical protein
VKPQSVKPPGKERRPPPRTEGVLDVAQWAAIWSTYAGVPVESPDYLSRIDAWRNAWRPGRVRFLLVAESHMGELEGDLAVHVIVPPEVNTVLPEGYCRLVYCLGYGENKLCNPSATKNAGTWQYWEIFGTVAWGWDRRTPPSAQRERLDWKFETLNRLSAMGVWLVDASKAACSDADRGRRFGPRDYRLVVRESWCRFVWPSLDGEAPESIWIIGRGVGGVLQGRSELARPG